MTSAGTERTAHGDGSPLVDGRLPRTPITRSRRRQPKISELVARDIVDQIINENLPTGTRLPTEREMATAMGIGRTTLREALRLLETRGVITIRSGPGGGPIVSRPEPSDLSEALTLFLQFHESTLADVRQARQAIEPMLTRLVAEQEHAATVLELESCVEALRASIDSQEQFLAEATRFHEIIAAASGSVVLSLFFETLGVTVNAAATNTDYSEDRRMATLESHEAILRAVKSGDGAAAFQAMLEHLEETDAEWRRLNGADLSRPIRWLP